MVNTPQGSGRVRQPRNHQEEHHAVEDPQLWSGSCLFFWNKQTHTKQKIQNSKHYWSNMQKDTCFWFNVNYFWNGNARRCQTNLSVVKSIRPKYLSPPAFSIVSRICTTHSSWRKAVSQYYQIVDQCPSKLLNPSTESCEVKASVAGGLRWKGWAMSQSASNVMSSWATTDAWAKMNAAWEHA